MAQCAEPTLILRSCADSLPSPPLCPSPRSYYALPALLIEFTPGRAFSLQQERELGSEISANRICSKVRKRGGARREGAGPRQNLTQAVTLHHLTLTQPNPNPNPNPNPGTSAVRALCERCASAVRALAVGCNCICNCLLTAPHLLQRLCRCACCCCTSRSCACCGAAARTRRCSSSSRSRRAGRRCLPPFHSTTVPTYSFSRSRPAEKWQGESHQREPLERAVRESR